MLERFGRWSVGVWCAACSWSIGACGGGAAAPTNEGAGEPELRAPSPRAVVVAPAAPGWLPEPAQPISPDDRYLLRSSGVASERSVHSVGGKVLFEPAPGLLAVNLTPDQAEALRADPEISELAVDPRRYLLGAPQQTPYGVAMVQAPELAAGSTPVKVCVIDSGYFRAHEDLPSAVTGSTDSGSGPWSDDNCGHGTHVAGTIAALDNAVGVVGVASSSAQLHVVKVFGDNCEWTYSSALVRAVYECVQAGARVINMSLGGPTPYWFEEVTFEWAHLKGVLSIAAAGNAGNDSLGYPAAYADVVSVAAVGANGQAADFSQQNADVELAAPGLGVLSTVPVSGSSGYSAWNGTSMAAPHVAGVAALLWSHNPRWTNVDIRRALQASAFDAWPPGRDASTGFGIVQGKKALALLTGTCNAQVSCP